MTGSMGIFFEIYENDFSVCLSFASFSIPINGSPKGFFPVRRGIRQSYPLSLFLFVLVGEALSRMTKAMMQANLIGGFKPVSDALVIDHIQFANYTIFFCEAIEDQIMIIKAIFLCFEVVLGLKVNFFKSEIIGVKVLDHPLSHLTDIMGDVG